MDSQLPGSSNLGKKLGERWSQGPTRVSFSPRGATFYMDEDSGH